MQTASGSGGPMAIDERVTTENEQATATTERERAAAENDQAMASHSGGEEVAGRATAENDQVTASLSGGEEVAGRATAENDQATASLSGGEEVGGQLWAMEAVGTLINGFGLRLQHILPRMRCWAMKKRPRNGVQIISKIEANIRAGKAQVLEELKPTDDEVGADYWVGVDFDMSMGPQFIPLVEMKEKNELLDDGDDGDDGGDGGDGGDGDGDGVDGSDGGDGDGGEVGEGGDRDDVGDRGTFDRC
ncbi:hypothetical protein Q3G72_004173 [Acer saccharum]|nr:hypothetical protein Q3G72_004173 [Acer saccharum]